MKKAIIVTILLILTLGLVPLVSVAFSDSTPISTAAVDLAEDPNPYPYPPSATPTPGFTLPIIFR
jgi:hypothetical protein